ncbi:helix-turn-helix domain-containing protein [Rhizobium leguminosarum]|uniref:Helix-turn-helix domain-containing protein n=1 Tax=Rhizobium leguminosarum TaxID=384 RepID=A0A6P0BG44_RHILE|nr:XRE family transcriptional regulator [Rhizobium leguminosarum]NEI38765.1 helix-turn-helix domain-containing protein [Rhizobium leguminosarum]NEI45413.1 helix-turn-helix domain-containing protein [Rhizobium leguminosarum]
MARTLDDVLQNLPAERRERLERLGNERLEEYRTLQDLRKARDLTQVRMAETLGVKQENISRLEKRSDLLLSTLRGYVGAMGGTLELVARFPDREPVVLSSLFDDDAEPTSKPRTPRSRVKKHRPAA